MYEKFRNSLRCVAGAPKGPLWGSRYAAQTDIGYMLIHALRVVLSSDVPLLRTFTRRGVDVCNDHILGYSELRVPLGLTF